MMLFTPSVSSAPSQHLSENVLKPIIKLNHGVLFLPQERFSIILDYFHATFMYNLPKRPLVQDLLALANDITNATGDLSYFLAESKSGRNLLTVFENCAASQDCDFSRLILKHISLTKYHSGMRLKEILETMKDHIPLIINSTPRMKRSGWQSFLNYANVASYSQLQQVNDNLFRLLNSVSQISEQFASTIGKLHTITKALSIQSNQID